MEDYNVQDERVVQTKRKIHSYALIGVMVVLGISCIIQQYFLRAPFSQIAVEFFTFIGCGLFLTLARHKEGLDVNNSKKLNLPKIIIGSIVTALAAVVGLWFLSGIRDAKILVIFFIVVGICFFSGDLFMAYLNKKKKEAMDRQLDEDEMTI